MGKRKELPERKVARPRTSIDWMKTYWEMIKGHAFRRPDVVLFMLESLRDRKRGRKLQNRAGTTTKHWLRLGQYGRATMRQDNYYEWGFVSVQWPRRVASTHLYPGSLGGVHFLVP